MNLNQMRQLAILAGAISLEAPLRRNGSTPTTYVAWKLVEKIRAIQDEMGFDWHTQARKIRQAGTRTNKLLRRGEGL